MPNRPIATVDPGSAVAVRRATAGHEFVGKMLLLALIVVGFVIVMHFLPLLANSAVHAVVHQVPLPTSPPTASR